MVKDTLASIETRMKKSVESLHHHLASVRTGRASPALLDKVEVEYYGEHMPISQLANVAVPEARMLTIQPWDQTAIKAIEKGIQNANLGLNPTNDGRMIRLAIPPLTEQRRKDLTKVVRKEVEEAKISMRNLRRDGQTELKKLESDKQISADELKRAQEKLQELTDRFTKELDNIGATKEAEVMEV